MDRLTQEQQDQLSRYMDGEMNPAQREKFEIVIQHNESLKTRLAELQAVHHALKNSTLDQPSKNFTLMVMRNLNQYPLQATGISIRNGILLLIGVLLAAGIASVLVAMGVFDASVTTLDPGKLSLPEKFMDRTVPSIPFNGKLIVNIIILLNLGLAWLVLDKTILKPYFQRRMQAGQ